MLNLSFFVQKCKECNTLSPRNVSNVGVIGLDQSVGVVLPVRLRERDRRDRARYTCAYIYTYNDMCTRDIT